MPSCVWMIDVMFMYDSQANGQHFQRLWIVYLFLRRACCASGNDVDSDTKKCYISSTQQGVHRVVRRFNRVAMYAAISLKLHVHMKHDRLNQFETCIETRNSTASQNCSARDSFHFCLTFFVWGGVAWRPHLISLMALHWRCIFVKKVYDDYSRGVAYTVLKLNLHM